MMEPKVVADATPPRCQYDVVRMSIANQTVDMAHQVTAEMTTVTVDTDGRHSQPVAIHKMVEF